MTRRYILVWLLAAVAALIFISPPFMPAVKAVILFPSRAVTATLRGISGFFSFVSRVKKIDGENFELKKHIAELEVENSVIRARISDLERAARYKYLGARFVVSSIIAREPTNWFKTVTVDAGSGEGIVNGMCVVLPHGVVGRVIGVDRGSAVVMLAVDNSSRISAVASPTRELGIIEGTGQGLLLRFFSSAVQAKPGDAVLTSGLGGIFPKGLEIGRISAVKTGGLVAVAEVVPAVEFNKLEEVLIMK